MTFNETIELLKNIDSLFPSASTDKLTDEQLQIKAMFWADIMKDIGYKQALDGLRHYAATNTSGFAPQPAHILNYARQKNRLSDAEIEIHLRRALCDSTYHSTEQFDKLPDELKKIIGSPGELQKQAMREVDDTRIYIKSVCKEYRARVDGGTLDNTLITAGDEAERIAETMKKNKGALINGVKNERRI